MPLVVVGLDFNPTNATQKRKFQGSRRGFPLGCSFEQRPALGTGEISPSPDRNLVKDRTFCFSWKTLRIRVHMVLSCNCGVPCSKRSCTFPFFKGYFIDHNQLLHPCSRWSPEDACNNCMCISNNNADFNFIKLWFLPYKTSRLTLVVFFLFLIICMCSVCFFKKLHSIKSIKCVIASMILKDSRYRRVGFLTQNQNIFISDQNCIYILNKYFIIYVAN